MPSRNQCVVLAVAALFAPPGCVVRTYEPYRPVRETVVAEPVVEGPVIDAPGVEVVQVEPPPEERVYVYDPGYPPGVYFYNNYYWYGGYRYPRDVFINRYVAVNVREHRYINVEENRRLGRQIEIRHRTEFAANRGRPVRQVRPAARPEHREREHE